MIYLNRYTTTPLLWGSIIFLAHKLATEITNTLRQNLLEEAAAQVVHGVRSPIMALRLASDSYDEDPKMAKALIQNSIRRIEDIAMSLRVLDKTQVNIVNISEALTAIVLEKKAELNCRRNLQIELIDYTDGSQALVKADASHLARAISNLLNNAIEAIPEQSKITISLKTRNNLVVLEIADTGHGMPEELIQRLGERGLTHGKAFGSGLGIFHAKKVIESWNGSFVVSSKLGAGTKVQVELPIHRK